MNIPKKDEEIKGANRAMVEELYESVKELINEEKNYPEAIKKCEEIIKINPFYLKAICCYGLALLRLERYAEAIQKFQECEDKLALNNVDHGFVEEKDKKNSEAKMLQSWAAALTYAGKIESDPSKYWEEAVKKYEQILDGGSCYAKTQQVQVQILNNLGVALALLGKFDNALEKLNEAEKIDPSFKGTFNNRGLVRLTEFQELKKKEEALRIGDLGFGLLLDDLNNAISDFEIAGEFADSISHGFALEFLGKKEEAIHKYRSYYNRIRELVNEHHDKENKIFFRFRKLDKNTLSELINGEIFCANPITYNDPYDCRLMEGQSHYVYPEGFREVFSDIRICSFSSISKSGSISEGNILMWSHYAESHKGICIEYEVGENRKDNFGFYQVIYRDRVVLGEHKDLFRIKFNDWTYENEWRLVYYDENIGKSKLLLDLKKNDLRIKSIIFGLECPDVDRMVVANLIKENNNFLKDVKLFEMGRADARYGQFKLEKKEWIPPVHIDPRRTRYVTSS